MTIQFPKHVKIAYRRVCSLYWYNKRFRITVDCAKILCINNSEGKSTLQYMKRFKIITEPVHLCFRQWMLAYKLTAKNPDCPSTCNKVDLPNLWSFRGHCWTIFGWHPLSNGPRQANLVLIAYVSSEGSGKPAHPRSLARTSAARSYKQCVKRNLQTENQIPGPSEWLGMRS